MLLYTENQDSESLDITGTLVLLIKMLTLYMILAACSIVQHCLWSDSALFCIAKSPGLGKMWPVHFDN